MVVGNIATVAAVAVAAPLAAVDAVAEAVAVADSRSRRHRGRISRTRDLQICRILGSSSSYVDK